MNTQMNFARNSTNTLNYVPPIIAWRSDAVKNASRYLVSECPLAADHILQGMERVSGDMEKQPSRTFNPIELVAEAYGLTR